MAQYLKISSALHYLGFAGHDQMLAAGIYGSHMAHAAELLAYAKPAWPLKARAQRMFRDVIHPVLLFKR